MRLSLNLPLPMSEAHVRAQYTMGGLKERASAERTGQVDGGPRAGRLNQVVHEFEALLVEQMLKEMRNNIPDSPLFGPSRAREIFNEMLDGEYARAMENRGGLGLARFMIERMERS